MKVVIIGNGISGITAARWIRKLSAAEITVISDESKHFFSRTALMYVFMGHMRLEDIKPYEDWFWEKNKINLIQDQVHKIDFQSKSVEFSSSNLTYDKLIIATGSKSNKFGWPGQDLPGVSGLYHLQDLENMENYSKGLKRAVIVGGGLIGLEMAEMFHSRKIPVTMLVRENEYWDNVLPMEEASMISEEIRRNHIDLRLETQLDKICKGRDGKVSGVIVKGTGEKIDCGYVGLTAGVHPNITLVKESELAIDRGILVNNYLETNVEDVYAIGDCAQLEKPKQGRRGIEAVWYTGRMMGETVAHTITGQPTEYDPGIWFNSAKFLDIEYQVYGYVPRVPEENIETIFWQNNLGNKSIRLVYSSKTNKILGFNLLGIRYRHEVCEKWIKMGATMIHVLENLCLANFDPEFFPMYEHELVHLYNQKKGLKMKIKSKRKLDRVLKFLKS
jgi:NAD(P)H-nitrite reductase large subunit